MKDFEILPTACDHYLVRNSGAVTKYDHNKRFIEDVSIDTFNDLKSILQYTVTIPAGSPEQALIIFKQKDLHLLKRLFYLDFTDQLKGLLSDTAEEFTRVQCQAQNVDCWHNTNSKVKSFAPEAQVIFNNVLEKLQNKFNTLSINIYSIQEVTRGILDEPYITIDPSMAYKEYSRLAVEECGFRTPLPDESFEDYRASFSDYDDYDNPELKYNRDDYELHFTIHNIKVNEYKGV